MKAIVIIGLFLAGCGQEPAGTVKLARAIQTGGKVSRGIKAIIDKKITKMKEAAKIDEKEADLILFSVDLIFKEPSITKEIDDYVLSGGDFLAFPHSIKKSPDEVGL